MATDVAFLKIKTSVQATVGEAMRLCGWEKAVSGDSFFLKVNLLSKEVVPGQCTSPGVFEGVLREVREKFPHARIFFGDSDVATANQLNSAVKNWGFDKIGTRYSARFVNLSRSETISVSFGKIFRDIQLPKILLDMDNILTIPVVKTHCLTPFTGGLKNQWGLLPKVRFKYHPVVHEAIAEINAFFAEKMRLGVADITVAMEGPGPRVGTPKICNAIMASRDLVALDAAVATYMGLDPYDVEFLAASERNGVGARAHRMMGDPFSPEPFKPGKGKDYFIYRWRDRIKEIPGLGRFILENTFPFRFLGFLAVLYYRFVWYNRYGRKYAESVCRDPFYRDQFEPLMKRR
jgi:uncharacterized protein (DUF362 family)